MSTGFVLNIDEQLIDNLTQADKLVERIGKHSEQTEKLFNTAFAKMTTGSLDDFVKKLMSARQAIQDIGDAKVSDKGLGSISTQAVQGADSVNNLVESITRLMQVAQGREKVQPVDINSINIAEDTIDSLREKIATLKRLLSQNRQGLIDETQQQNAKLLLDEINRLQVAYGNLRTEQKNLQSFDKAFSLSEETISQTESKLAKMRELWSNLYKDPQKYEEELKKVTAEIQRLIKRKSDLKKLTTFEGAMDFSKSTKSIKDQIQAIKYLKTARENLSKEGMSEADYRKKVKELTDEIKRQQKEVDKLVGKNSDLGKSHKSLINTADQLKRAFALMFSVSAIKGYVTQIARVRGEFELQQRSLQAILQNKDEADRLWQQTIQLAVRSPFQVKELVTYTKQLAAYRVESDKLYDTTKMLADVSAGLGVDMNRLILAYGQVKAANYLRGTELRQFSEAGVNILEELAKYFEEVEGRAVSVGEVFERVSKRMVTFADVEEIFKRITSEGGIFYNMQEVQAETLKGQISNLRDAIDIMLNEIGKEGEGAMKSSIATLRELISNWKEVEFYLSKVIVAYATYKGAVGIASLANSSLANSLLNIITKSDTATKAFDRLSNGIGNVLSKLFKSQAAISGIKTFLGGLATLGVTAALAAIAVGLVEVWRRATKTTRELKALNKELEQIYSQDTNALDKQIRGFENLVNRLKTVNKGTREHKDIIGALNQNYGEYLGFIVNETTTYEQLANNINSVNLALTNKAKLNTYEKAYGKVLEKNNEIISERQETIKKQLEKVDVLRAGDIIQLNENEINDIFALFEKKVAKAGRAGYDLAKEAFKEYGVEIEYGDIFNWGVFTEYGEAVLRNKEEETKLQNKINSLYGGTVASTIEMRKELERINDAEKKELANAETRRQKEEVLLKYAKQRIDAEVKYEGLAADVAAKRYAELEKKSKTVIDVNEKIAKSVNKLGAKYAEQIYIDDEQAAQGIDSIAKSAAESYELQNAIIDSQNKLKAAGTVYDKKALVDAEKSAEAYKYLLTLLGRTDLIKKSSNETEDEATKRLKAQISLIKEMNKEYEKLRKKYSEEDARSKVSQYFTNTAKSFGLDITQSLFDDKGTKASLEKLFAQVPERLRPLVQKALDNVEVDIYFTTKAEQNKELKQQVEDLFSRYDITLDLEKLGLSKDLMSSLFDEEALDLSGLREAIEGMQQQFIGKDMEKEYQQYLDKIADMEKKAVVERTKTYVKYLMEAQREAVKIKVEELRKLKEVEESKEFSPTQKEEIKDRIRKETNADLQKQEWADFQNTEMYTMMFEDLEHYGTQALETLREKLEELKGSLTDLPASEVKEIINQLSKIEDITIERNPFRALKETRKQIKDEGVSEQQAQTNLAQSENAISKLQSELDIINIVNTAKSKGLQIDKETQYAYDVIVVDMADMGVAENDIVATKEKSLKVEKENAKAAKKTLDNYERQGKARIAALNKTKNILGSVQDATKASMELMDSLGVSSDSIGYTLAESADGMISLTLSAIEFGIQMEIMGYQSNMALGIIGWIAIGIQAVAKVLSTIFKMHDAGLQKQIDKLAVQTEDLQEKFDALSDAVDNAYNTDQLRTAAAEAKQYTQQMIANYEKMKQLEEDKKKTDKDAVKEYEDNIKEQREALRELEQQIVSEATAGIFDNVVDAASGFVDAWYEAFKETGDGLKGLEDNFDEMFLNLAKQQATMQIAGRFAKQWEKDLSKYINETDTELTKAEAQKWAEEVKATFPALNDALEGFLGVITDGVGATGELSGLQAGIQGITESQAEILSAYANSCRFFLSSINTTLSDFATKVFDTEGDSNPILSQLRIVAQQTTAINSLLSSLTKGGHTEGGLGLKVFIN